MDAYAAPPEWLDYPSNLSASDLVIGGSGPGPAAQQTAELVRLLARASSTVDQWCYHPLYAHAATDQQEVRPDPYSRLTVRLPDFPVLSVTSAQWRQGSAAPWSPLAAATLTLYPTLARGHKYVADNFPFGAYGRWGRAPLTVQTQYVAGYVNAALTTNSVAGATTLTVDTTVGMAVGDVYTVFDSANTETVSVAAVDTTTVSLAAPTLNAHGVGVRLGNLPEAVTLATIWFVNAMIKTRRAGGGVTMAGKLAPSGLDSQEWKDARELLQPFRRVV